MKETDENTLKSLKNTYKKKRHKTLVLEQIYQNGSHQKSSAANSLRKLSENMSILRTSKKFHIWQNVVNR